MAGASGAASHGSARVLLLFLDGVGIGPDDPSVNPFLTARLPTLSRLLGRIPTLRNPRLLGPGAVALPLDATLGSKGLPQSGTGQTSLLTGRNAAAIFGRHFGPWTPVRLRGLLEEENVLSRALSSGATAAFANAYPRGYPGDRDPRRVAAPALAAEAAGLLNRHAEALSRGDAVASEIVNEGWRVHLGHRDLPPVTPRQAGLNLARIAAAHDLTFYAHYATDLAGHRGGMAGAVEALERVDAFLGGVVEGLDGSAPDTLLLVASDHGNVEDMTRQHTRNPALGLVRGPGAEAVASGLASITDLAGAILGLLDPS